MTYLENKRIKGDCPAKPTSASASNLPYLAGQQPGWRCNPLEVRMDAKQNGGQPDGELLVLEPVTKSKRPPFYKVILLNDDYTPMDFVVMVIEAIFRKSHEDAVNLMLEIHTKGAAVVGVFTRDVAETKADQVIEYARVHEHPLQCVIEKE